MLRLTTPGTRNTIHPSSLAGSTFVELVVTIFLLSAFAATAFPIFWGAAKANTAHAIGNAQQRADLSLASVLPRFCEKVRPPYWVNPDKVFQNSGDEWKVCYFDGKENAFLVLRKESGSRLGLRTSDTSLSIDNLSGLTLHWWTKEKRIIGFVVRWQQGDKNRELHVSWGSFVL